MMVYFDTNVLLYAFAENIDDNRQKEISIKLVEDAIDNNTIIVSHFVTL